MKSDTLQEIDEADLSAKKKAQKRLFKKLTQFFQKQQLIKDKIETILVFGSYARLDYKEESDIDLCLILKPEVKLTDESKIHQIVLDLSHKMDKSIDVLYIRPKTIDEMDHTTLGTILAQGHLILGNNNYKELFLSKLKLMPFQVIEFNLKHLSKSEKMKFTRMLYGYETTVQYSQKRYKYKHYGILDKVQGRRLGAGSILIPEGHLSIIETKFTRWNVPYSNFRIWKPEI